MHGYRLSRLISCLLILLAAVPATAEDFASGEERAAMLMDSAAARLQAELRSRGLAEGSQVYLRIFKLEGVLEVWMADGSGRLQQWRTYPICAYSGFPGPKLAEGDWQSPEGFYAVTADQLNPESRHHLAINIGYPNAFDSHWQRTGSAIMIHGECSSVGCFAMGNRRIEEIYYLVYQALAAGNGPVSVHIFPFHLTDTNLKKFAQSPWIGFWRSMQQGYLAFETERRVPAVSVIDGHYRISGPLQFSMQVSQRSGAKP